MTYTNSLPDSTGAGQIRQHPRRHFSACRSLKRASHRFPIIYTNRLVKIQHTNMSEKHAAKKTVCI